MGCKVVGEKIKKKFVLFFLMKIYLKFFIDFFNIKKKKKLFFYFFAKLKHFFFKNIKNLLFFRIKFLKFILERKKHQSIPHSHRILFYHLRTHQIHRPGPLHDKL